MISPPKVNTIIYIPNKIPTSNNIRITVGIFLLPETADVAASPAIYIYIILVFYIIGTTIYYNIP